MGDDVPSAFALVFLIGVLLVGAASFGGPTLRRRPPAKADVTATGLGSGTCSSVCRAPAAGALRVRGGIRIASLFMTRGWLDRLDLSGTMRLVIAAAVGRVRILHLPAVAFRRRPVASPHKQDANAT